MLWLVGVGINGIKGISLLAIETLKKCDSIYVEKFTSLLSEHDVRELESIIGKKIAFVQRWFVEDGREIMESAKNSDVALVTYGDPLIATTHAELLGRAAKGSIKVQVIHSASGISSLIGETGLHIYKFGRTVTMMSDPQSAISVYNTVFDNLLSGNHTLILTEYNNDNNQEPFFLKPQAVFDSLLKVEESQKHGVFSTEMFAFVASRIGDDDQKIVSGKLKSLASVEFGNGPHSIIIPGPMHFTESDAVSLLTENIDLPLDNTKSIRRVSTQMVEKYSPKARQALEQMRAFIRGEKTEPSLKKGMYEVLDNAEYYIDDAERFLRQGKHDLAVLSIGYAEGLIDSLRFQKGINPWS